MKKLWIGALAVFVAALLYAIGRLRNTPGNNLRRARSLHERASRLHESGNEGKARSAFEKSNYYREKAYEDGKNAVA